MSAPGDNQLMRAAIGEALKGRGQTSPNPIVGAVLTVAGRIVAKGFHRGAGEPHAEIECLRAFGSPLPNGATLYVTLEPCSTSGRTPPCTDALISAGLRHLVVGALDPNPKHQGRGLRLLKRGGIDVRCDVLAKECAALNESFNKWIVQKRPFVIAKCGMSLDGHLTRLPNEERWITSPAARAHANAFRAQVDAIMIGAETLRSDNPRLTVRGIRGARQPLRVIMTRSGQLPRESHVFSDRLANRTVVFRKLDLDAVLRQLGERDVTSVLIEGGGDLLGQAADERLIDKFHIYIAPLLTGGPKLAFAGAGAGKTSDAVKLSDIRFEQVGADVLLTGRANYAGSFSE